MPIKKVVSATFSWFILISFLFGQTQETSTQSLPLNQGKVNSILYNGESVPLESIIHGSLVITPFGNIKNYSTGEIVLGIAGIASIAWKHDITFGTPFGDFEPLSLVEFRAQILDQREKLPAVTLIFSKMLKKRDGAYGINDFSGSSVPFRSLGLYEIYYNADNSTFAVGLSSIVNDKVSVSLTLGIREFNWQQGFTWYAIEGTGDPDWVNVQPQKPIETTPNIYISGRLGYNLTQNILLTGSIQAIPILEIEESTLALTTKNGYRNSLGVQYNITSRTSIELYDEYISGYIKTHSYHHLRIGLNTALAFK